MGGKASWCVFSFCLLFPLYFLLSLPPSFFIFHFYCVLALLPLPLPFPFFPSICPLPGYAWRRDPISSSYSIHSVTSRPSPLISPPRVLPCGRRPPIISLPPSLP
ncbi:hypothetical protein C8R44DRAFT_775642 [Mycena epipterygia]|nr:hypothetical protein C8R44DRAFT_775642 [Mycena epipterygia]